MLNILEAFEKSARKIYWYTFRVNNKFISNISLLFNDVLFFPNGNYRLAYQVNNSLKLDPVSVIHISWHISKTFKKIGGFQISNSKAFSPSAQKRPAYNLIRIISIQDLLFKLSAHFSPSRPIKIIYSGNNSQLLMYLVKIQTHS